MWLLFLKKYWQQVAIVMLALSAIWYFHHSWYSDGYAAAKADTVAQHDADIDRLNKDKNKAIGDLHKAEQSLAQEKAAKDAALKAASKAPKILTVHVHDKATNCDIPSIGPDFERVWNSQAKAASTDNKPLR